MQQNLKHWRKNSKTKSMVQYMGGCVTDALHVCRSSDGSCWSVWWPSCWSVWKVNVELKQECSSQAGLNNETRVMKWPLISALNPLYSTGSVNYIFWHSHFGSQTQPIIKQSFLVKATLCFPIIALLFLHCNSRSFCETH